jgi:hypothetical protein
VNGGALGEFCPLWSINGGYMRVAEMDWARSHQLSLCSGTCIISFNVV